MRADFPHGLWSIEFANSVYFVYDKGDKIDWNHPNRAGHARIAEGFIRSGACGFLERQPLVTQRGE
jgi:hypothetical protein